MNRFIGIQIDINGKRLHLHSQQLITVHIQKWQPF